MENMTIQAIVGTNTGYLGEVTLNLSYSVELDAYVISKKDLEGYNFVKPL